MTATPSVQMEMREVVAALYGRRFSLTNEKTTQAEIAEALIAAGIPTEREVRLGDSGIVDVMCGRIAIEVKLAGGKRAIHRQCVRYCERPEVAALILATSVSTTLPSIDKPTFVLSLGKAWL